MCEAQILRMQCWQERNFLQQHSPGFEFHQHRFSWTILTQQCFYKWHYSNWTSIVVCSFLVIICIGSDHFRLLCEVYLDDGGASVQFFFLFPLELWNPVLFPRQQKNKIKLEEVGGGLCWSLDSKLVIPGSSPIYFCTKLVEGQGLC